MNDVIIAAIIAGLTSIAASIITVISVQISNNKTQAATDAKLDKAQAITETKLDALTVEVQKHNNFAARMPIVEEQIKTIQRRLDNLEKKVG